MNYVPTPDVIGRLNEATEGDWDFEIKERWETRNSAGTIIEVHLYGRLTYKEWVVPVIGNPYLKTISKEDIGGASVKFKKDYDQDKKTEESKKKEPRYLSITSDWKIAASDLFKRCARQFGLGNHLWSKTEEPEPEIEEEDFEEEPEAEEQKSLPAKYQNLLLEAAEAVGVDINGVKDTVRRQFDKKVIELSIPEAEKLIKQFNEITSSLT